MPIPSTSAAARPAYLNAANWSGSSRQLIASSSSRMTARSLSSARRERYQPHFVRAEDLTADVYEIACERLAAAGIEQYEISNLARAGWRSKHNLKYWTRQPYIGVGVDAHSMLPPNAELRAAGVNAIRYFWPDSLERLLDDNEDRGPTNEIISELSALEETFFLSLLLNRG